MVVLVLSSVMVKAEEEDGRSCTITETKKLCEEFDPRYRPQCVL